MLAVTYLHTDTVRHAEGEGWQAAVLHATAESQRWMLSCVKSQVLWQGCRLPMHDTS